MSNNINSQCSELNAVIMYKMKMGPKSHLGNISNRKHRPCFFSCCLDLYIPLYTLQAKTESGRKFHYTLNWVPFPLFLIPLVMTQLFFPFFVGLQSSRLLDVVCGPNWLYSVPTRCGQKDATYAPALYTTTPRQDETWEINLAYVLVQQMQIPSDARTRQNADPHLLLGAIHIYHKPFN